MPRARNIKPSFFVNEELGEIEPLGRLLFIGLWTLADYKGDLEWKPKRIKLQTIPYDDASVEALAINLDKSGLIRFYSNGENIYLRIVNFLKHQNPHKNERDKGSDIPAYSDEMRQAIDLKGLAINLDKSGVERNDSTSNPADSLFLIPDSCSLNPETASPPTESGILSPDMSGKPDDVREILDFLNEKAGRAFKAVDANTSLIKARLKEGHSKQEIMDVIARKCIEWPPGHDMNKYLRPETLFGARKFNGYVGELAMPSKEEIDQQKLERWLDEPCDAIEGQIL